MEDGEFFDRRWHLDTDPRYSIDLAGNVYGISGGRLKPSTSTGYEVVSIGRKSHYVHRLMAQTFIPNPHGKPDVAHWDNDGLNNWVGNLRWAYESENMSDKKRHGTNRGHSKLSPEDVSNIRSRKGSYWGVQQDLAREYGVSDATISEIMNGWHWKEVA